MAFFQEMLQKSQFEEDNAPVHKSKIIGVFSKKTRGKYWNGQHTVQM